MQSPWNGPWCCGSPALRWGAATSSSGTRIIPAWQLLLDGNEVSLHRRAEGAEAAAERRLQAVKAPSPAISTAVTQAELTAEEPVPDIALGLVTWDASHRARSTYRRRAHAAAPSATARWTALRDY